MRNSFAAEYVFTQEYSRYLKNGIKVNKKMLKKSPADDLCVDMFDAEIDAKTDKMKVAAAEQYTDHLFLIRDQRMDREKRLVEKKAEYQRLCGKCANLESRMSQMREMNPEKSLRRLEKQYDKLYILKTRKECEITKLGNPLEFWEGALAREVDSFMEFIDLLESNARDQKIAIRKIFMERAEDPDLITNLTRSCQEIMSCKKFRIDAEAEYLEFVRRQDERREKKGKNTYD